MGLGALFITNNHNLFGQYASPACALTRSIERSIMDKIHVPINSSNSWLIHRNILGDI